MNTEAAPLGRPLDLPAKAVAFARSEGQAGRLLQLSRASGVSCPDLYEFTQGRTFRNREALERLIAYMSSSRESSPPKPDDPR